MILDLFCGCVFVLTLILCFFHMEWDFAQVFVKWNPEFQLKRGRYN